MALSPIVGHGTLSLRKVVTASVVAALASVLWMWTRNGLLLTMFLVLATIISALALFAVRARRRSEALVRAKAESAFQSYIDNIATHLDLDRRLMTNPFITASTAETFRQVQRTPMAHGRGSHFLNKIVLIGSGSSRVQLVEKGVDRDGNELRFWHQRNARWTLQSARYQSLEPVAVVQGKVVSVAYFQYLPEFDRDRSLLIRGFRANLNEIASAVGEFNGRNLILPDRSLTQGSTAFIPVRPTSADLERKLNVSSREASALRESWEEVYDRWDTISAAYNSLPQCLCHNDISPGNAIYLDGTTTLSDFGLVGAGPVGSDLHTLIRWSGKAIDDQTHVERLLTMYLDSLRAYDCTVTIDDLCLSAWTTFFLRYTNLKLTSAQHLHAFALAVRRMTEVLHSRTHG